MAWIIWAAIVVVLMFGLTAFIGAPYVPSHKRDIRQAFSELYPLSDDDFVIDVGSGDGVVLREVSKLGGSGLGLEINPILVFISNYLSRKDKKIHFKLVNYWISHLPQESTVIYTFSVTRDIQKIADWVQKEATLLKKPLYLITYGSEPISIRSVKAVGAYNLYKFRPLQSTKAQV